MIVFASPGMLHAGYSLHLFKKWAPEEKNMVSFFLFRFIGTKMLLILWF